MPGVRFNVNELFLILVLAGRDVKIAAGNHLRRNRTLSIELVGYNADT